MAFCYNVNIRQENEPNLEEFSDDVFKINTEFRYISSLNAETTIDIFNQTMVFGRDMFLSDQHHRDIILCMALNSRASPEFIESAVFPPTLRFARDANSNPVNLGLKVINMKVVVEIIVDVNIIEEDDINYDDEWIDESLMNTEINFTPANRSSIEGLKRVKWDPMTKREDECAICLEEFVKGKEVASMPCGHGYHDGCIIKWLKNSHLCPLCRYQMPTLIHL